MPSGPGSRRVIGTLQASKGRSVLMVTVELLGSVLLMEPDTSLWTYIKRRPMLAAISRSKLTVVSHVFGDSRFGFSIRLLAAVMLLKSELFTSRFTSPGS